MRGARNVRVIKPAADMQSSINVTPLVDVVLVLLIIFMVVMPLKEKDFGARIPTQEQVEIPSEVPPDQIVVDISKNGDFMLNGAVIPRESYIPALQTRLGSTTQRIIFVSPHAEAAYPFLIEAFEGARAAGAETLAMLPDVEGEVVNIQGAAPAGEAAPEGLPGGAAPAGLPSGAPAGLPSGAPAGLPSGAPAGLPSGAPAGLPSGAPAGLPGAPPSSP